MNHIPEFKRRTKAVLLKYSLGQLIASFTDAQLEQLFNQHKTLISSINSYESAIIEANKFLASQSYFSMSLNSLISESDLKDLYEIFIDAKNKML